MNAIELLTGPLAQAIGWALLHLLWQATIVAGILAAVLALIPRESANARYGAACSALALVFAMFVATAIRSYDPSVAPVQTTMPSDQSVSVPLTKIPAVIVATAAASWRDRAMDAVTIARQSLPSVVAFWLLGVLFLSSRLLVSWIRARHLVNHGAVEAGRDIQFIAWRLSGALGLTRAVRLLESAAVEVPSVIGTLRPVILLPASALVGLTPQQLEMVLAHELAHIRRHDFLMNLLQAFVETLMFYHPAVWWMSRRVRIERENCCDDLAVAVCGNPLQYAQALTRLEELRANALPVVVAANGGSLLDRIRRIAAGRAESTSVSSRWAAAIATLAIVGLALAIPSVPALAQREEPAKPAATKIEVVEPADAAEPAEEAEAVEETEESYTDFDIDAPEMPEPPDVHVDVDVPHPPHPPHPPVPAPPVKIGALHDFDFDFDYDQDHDAADEDDDEESEPKRADGKLSVDELIALRANDVTPEYIQQMRALFPNASIHSLTGLRAVGVTPEFVAQMREAGLQVKKAHEASGLAAVGVTPQFIRQMRDAGLAVAHSHEATGLRAVGVTPEFIRGMRDAGMQIKAGHEATSLAAVGVTPEFIAQMRAAGLPLDNPHEATGLRAVGVTPEYIRAMRDAGVKITKAHEATSLAAVGVKPEFVKRLADAGYTNLSVHELTGMAAHGIDDDFIRDMERYRRDRK
jgi:beta-lactamase regulating signal transducer with metallopeptidase domain